MATAPPEPGARPGGPNPRLVFGCGAGCCVVLLAILALFVFSAQRQRQLNETVTEFVETAGGGDLQQAYGMVHNNLRQTKSFSEFEAEWSVARAQLGDFVRAQVATPKADLANSRMIVPFTLHGEDGTVAVAVAVNPNDKPMAILDYSFPGLVPSPGADVPPTEPAEPAETDATVTAE